MAIHSSITLEWNRSELVLESKRATTTLGEYLNKAWSWPERQERSGSVAEAPRLTMLNNTVAAEARWSQRGRSESVQSVARSRRA